MSEGEFAKLKEDIRINGLRSPIVFWRGQLIDGRHRIQACEELGIMWDNFAEEADADQDPVKVALSLNLHRRHLDPSQLAMVADKVRGIYDEESAATRKTTEGRPPKNKLGANLPQVKTREKKASEKAAEAVGVSGRSVSDAKKVRTKGVAELAAAVERGEVAVSAAAAIADLPKEQQLEIVSRDEVKDAAAAIREEKRRAAAAAKGADEQAVKALLAAANPLCVIEKVIVKFTQEQLTALYVRCEELLDKVA